MSIESQCSFNWEHGVNYDVFSDDVASWPSGAGSPESGWLSPCHRLLILSESGQVTATLLFLPVLIAVLWLISRFIAE